MKISRNGVTLEITDRINPLGYKTIVLMSDEYRAEVTPWECHALGFASHLEQFLKGLPDE